MARVAPGLHLGAEYAVEPDSWVPLANWHVLQEGRKRPSIMLGTSGDRQGVPHGQAYYLTVSKALNTKAPVIAPYLGASYGVEDKLRVIGGLNLRLSQSWSSILIHDGVNFHPTVTASWRRHDFTVMWVNTEDLGFSWSVRF